MTTTPFPEAPAPWSTKCNTWVLPFYQSATTPLPAEAYSPLTASHAPFSAEAQCGKYRGGVGMLQIVRYSETPVGPYDELVVMPGYFDTPVGGKKGARNTRITAIWVSQKDTCWNGRRNWNIPKFCHFPRHLARFKFTTLGSSPSPSSSTKVEVFPEDPSVTDPFFTATIKPMQWLPYFPCSTGWGSYLGVDSHLVQPPLPEGDAPELCGTEQWKKAKPLMSTKKASLVWIDLKQPPSKSETAGDGDEEDGLLEKKQKNENWWPGMRRWHVGMAFENATLTLTKPEILTA